MLREPPLKVTSSTVKSVDASERVNVIPAVSPMVNDWSSLSMVMIGDVVSGGTVFTLIVMLPAVLWLSAASVKVSAATEITPSAVLFTEGVNVAV